MTKERRYIQDLSPGDILKVDKIKFLFYEPIGKYGKRRIIGHRKIVYFGGVVEKKEGDKYYTHGGPMIVYVLKLGPINDFLSLCLVGFLI